MLAAATGGCGSDDPESSVRHAAERFTGSVGDRDFETVCDRDLSSGFREKLGRLGDCATAAAQVVRVRGEVGRVRVRGDEATVRLEGSRGSELRLVREDDEWLIDAVGDARAGGAGLQTPKPGE